MNDLAVSDIRGVAVVINSASLVEVFDIVGYTRVTFFARIATGTVGTSSTDCGHVIEHHVGIYPGIYVSL